MEEKNGKKNAAKNDSPMPFNMRELPFALVVFAAAFLAQMGLLLIGKAAGWEGFENLGLRAPLIMIAIASLKVSLRDMLQRLLWLVGGVACVLAGTLAVMLVVALLPSPDPDSLHGWILLDLVGLIVGIGATIVPLWLLARRLQGGETPPPSP